MTDISFAFDAGKKSERERIVGIAEGMKRDEQYASFIDDHVDIQNYNSALTDLISRIQEI